MKKISFILLTALLVVALSATTLAVTKTSAKTGNWNTASTWTPSGVPAAGDLVIIANTHTVTVNAAKTCASVTINTGGILTMTTFGLTIAGPWVNNGTFNAGTGTVTFSCTAAAIAGTGTGNFYTITLPTGINTLTINTSVVCTTFTMPQNTTNGDINTVNITGSNILTVLGVLSIDRISTFNVNTGTLNAASINMTGGSGVNQANLIITTGTVTVTGNIAFLGGITTIQKITLGSGTLNVGGTFDADGTLTVGTGTVNFTGTNQTIPPYTYKNLTVSGSGTVNLSGITVNGDIAVIGTATVTLPPTCNDLTVNNSNGITLNSATTISGNLIFTLGNLYLGNYNLTLNGSVVGAAASKCIVTNGTGVVSRSITAGNFTFPIGSDATHYNPLRIANNSTTAKTYTARIVTGTTPIGSAKTTNTCGQTWIITGTSADTVAFSWNTSEAGTALQAGLVGASAWRSDNGNDWIEQFSITAVGTPNATTVTGVTSFSSWIVGTGGSLPVEMTSFAAAAQNMHAQLKWNTATEVNNYGFEIERRAIASNAWEKVGFVLGSGTSNTAHNYTYADNNLSAGKYAYRLKQIDNDGAFKYSVSTEVEIIGVAKELKLFGNYPNPFNPSTKVQFAVPENGNVSLRVYNIIGQEVATLFDGAAEAGNIYTANFDGSHMASGLYFSVLEFGNQRITHKMMMTK